MEKLNVTLRVQWLTRDPFRFKLCFKRFTPLDWCSCRAVGVSLHRCPELALSLLYHHIPKNCKIESKDLQRKFKWVCQRRREREMTANKIRSCQKLFSQKAKKCPIHYSAPSFMFNGDLRRTRERRKSKVGCCVLVITDKKTLKISPFMFHRRKKVIHVRNNMR